MVTTPKSSAIMETAGRNLSRVTAAILIYSRHHV
jgi:hypothetical protein